MTATSNCPACGAPLPADAPAGLCPRCLLAGGLVTAASPPSADFTPPTVTELAPLFPQLEIVELLGAGGMGAVYKARQPNLDRLVALKVLPPNDDPSFTERFTREARTLAKLNHPGIVHIYDFGQAGGHSYIVMEFVGGVNLRQAERAGAMTPVGALAVVPQICAALQFAHEAGVVHRDIKPENILLDAKGCVKIADFGLAKLLGGAGPHHLTGTHQAMGTLHYMAPEQWEKPATVDHRADIYSLGVVFYELLTGELPLGRFAPPSEKVQSDVRLDQVVLRALEKEPERRYQQASDVKTDVERITAIPTPTVRTETELQPQRWSTSNVMAVCVIIASVLAWPFGMIALPTVWWIARKQKRSMVAVVDDVLHFLGLHRTVTWSIFVCIVGLANLFLPWVIMRNSTVMKLISGSEVGIANCPMLTATGFFLMGIFFFVTARLPRLQLWNACIALAGGATLTLIIAAFCDSMVSRRYSDLGFGKSLGPILNSAVTVDFGPGPFIAGGLAIGLMALGAINLRGYLVKHSHLLAGSSDGSPVLPTASTRTGGGGPRMAAVPPPVPERLNKPPPSTAAPIVRSKPRFLLPVGLPVLALVVVGLVAHEFATTNSGSSNQYIAWVTLRGVAFVGPIVVVPLFIRWLWLTLQPRYPTAFWVLAVASVSIVASWYFAVMSSGSTPQMRRSGSPNEQGEFDPETERWHELLIGRWEFEIGETTVKMDGAVQRSEWKKRPTIVFKPDGSFEAQEGPIANGPYHWTDNESIRIRLPSESLATYRVTVNESTLTLMEDGERGGNKFHTVLLYRRMSPLGSTTGH